ncbi:protein of unknown function [Persephonella hydrogeniphila]|uniref:DUF4139 domain-containing protein n=1 Tax=Persephonella hydrogeniphila TaxID=198703 RepID=A0A285NK25_9AQUI|nr:DUF4139 domain-containing protein [Persephonella hydrogeniphila]SNZ09842.1 protein of unknown function [Persephonella hydrogeniphila]
MKILKTGLLILITAGLSFADFPVPEKLFIYTDRAFLVEKIQIDVRNRVKIPVQLPLSTDIKQLKMSISDENCTVDYIRESQQNKEIKEKIQKLNAQINFFKDQIQTIDKEILLLERLDINKTGIEVINTFSQKYFKKLQEKRTAQEMVKNLKKEIDNIQKKYGKQLIVQVSCKEPSKPVLRITLEPPAKASQSYTISADTVNRKVSIINRISVKQDSGIDLKNISLIYYSYRRTPFIHPPEYPFFPVKKAVKMSVPERKYVESTTKAYFVVEKVDLENGRENLITLSKNIYPATFYVFIDGYASVTPFLKAEFSSDRFFPASYRAEFYVDGIYIGSDRIKPIPQGKNSLFFGEDIFFNVSKEKIKDYTEETVFGKKVTTKKWIYRMKNNHSKKIKVIVQDKIPVSPSEKREIEPFSSVKWKELKPDGTVIWEFFLNPTEEKIFTYGYKVIYQGK